MLSDKDIITILAVNDINEAKEFYEKTLGLTKAIEDSGGIYFNCGNSQLFLYESEFAGTNKATAAGWHVENLESAVAELKSKGVNFEHYDMPDVTLEGDIHSWKGQFKAAWFKDPSGNILTIDEAK